MGKKKCGHYWKTKATNNKESTVTVFIVRLHMGLKLRPYNEPKQEQNHNNFLQKHKMLSVVWPQQSLYCSGMSEHLVCYNNHLKACHVASHEEEIYNSLHHYISIPQNLRSTRTDNTNKVVSGHHTTYDYV